MIQLRISKIGESDEISSITITTTFKLFVCGVANLARKHEIFAMSHFKSKIQ